MSPSPSSLLDADQRARRYWYADGIPTLVVGLGLLMFGLSMLSVERETPLHIVLSFAALGLYGTLLLRRTETMDWLKTRLTYPRTGYVSPPVNASSTSRPFSLGLSIPTTDTTRDKEMQRVDWERHRRMGFATAMVLMMQVATIFISNRWLFTVAGIVIAMALWMVRKDCRVSPLLLLGFPSVGLAMTFFVPPGEDRVAWSVVGWGGLLILDGAIALIRYIGQNPTPKVPAA